MKALAAIVAVLAELTVGSCCCPPADSSSARETDMWAVNELADAQVCEAVIREHTLYPHHFLVDCAQLNELGMRDMDILAAYLRCEGGQLNVRRGDASPELYKKRVEVVAAALDRAGVPAGSVRVADGLPGGDGMPSVRVVEITRPKAPSGMYTQETRAPVTVGGNSQ
jgi:hypothetical protein